MDLEPAICDTYIKILLNSHHTLKYINAFLVETIYKVARNPKKAPDTDLNA